MKDDESDFAFLYGHMRERSPLAIGTKIKKGDYVGFEGATGNVTGIHVHVEMENYVKNGNKWIYDAGNPASWNNIYFNPSTYMGFPNELGIWVIYDGTPRTSVHGPTPTPTLKRKLKTINISKIIIK